MSIPVDFVSPVGAEIGKERMYGYILQLSDGSLYFIDGDTVVPMDRSYAGMVLKESIRQEMKGYNDTRRMIKEFRHRFNDCIDGKERERYRQNIASFEEISKTRLETVKKMRRGWRKFKNKSSARKRIVDPDEAARIKEAALTAKGIKKRIHIDLVNEAPIN
jgi:hypothetical protein